MDRPTVVIVCGLPFSGKTTFAVKAAEVMEIELVSLDAINLERGLGDDGQPIPGYEWLKSHAIAHARLAELVGEGKSAILDDTNYLRELRDAVRKAAGDADSITVWIDTPLDEIERRIEINRALNFRPDCPMEDFYKVVGGFEPPANDENPMRVDGVSGVEAGVIELAQRIWKVEPIPAVESLEETAK